MTERLIDGLDAYFKGDLNFKKAKETVQLEDRGFSLEDFERRNLLPELFRNSELINPVAKILNGASPKDPKEDFRRLIKLAYGERSKIKSRRNEDEESDNRQTLYRAHLP